MAVCAARTSSRRGTRWSTQCCRATDGNIEIVCRLVHAQRYPASGQEALVHCEIVRNAQGQYYWHLKAANGQIIAYSAETYTSKDSCVYALALVRQGAGTAPTYDRSS